MSSYIGPKPSDQVVGSVGFSNINVGANVVLSTVGLTVGALGTVSVGNSSVNCVANSSGIFENGLGLSPYAMRNKIINGAFNVWQRGSSITGNNSSSSASYWSDRWCFYRSGNAAAITLSSQITGGSTGVSSTFARIQRNSANTSTETVTINQSIEISNCTDIAGTTLTISFYARCGANYSSASNLLNVFVGTGTGSTDNNALWNVWTGYSYIVNATATLTQSWQKFTFTGIVGSSVTQAAVQFAFNPTGTAGLYDYIDITGVQLEVGSVSTPFERRPYGLELSLCQRYYYTSGPSTAPGVLFQAQGTNTTVSFVQHPVRMRASPTFSYSGTWTWSIFGGDSSISSLSSSTLNDFIAQIEGSTSGLTGGQAGRIRGGIYNFSIEL